MKIQKEIGLKPLKNLITLTLEFSLAIDYEETKQLGWLDLFISFRYSLSVLPTLNIGNQRYTGRQNAYSATNKYQRIIAHAVQHFARIFSRSMPLLSLPYNTEGGRTLPKTKVWQMNLMKLSVQRHMPQHGVPEGSW